ncbi:MAG TPA: SDR family oxidoreductase [Longimicrobiaceae bacterium]|nr:SDR family oxidoreductase [Longimicrobiaceae bacterium]
MHREDTEAVVREPAERSWALVTGASAGIGEAFARALAGRGMSLVLAARREDRLSALADELRRRYGVEAAVIPADLGKPGAAGVLWLEATDGREIDLLVNNAGFGAKGRFDEVPLERQAEMVRLNCTAPMELMHLALQSMRPRRRGAVVNVASVAAFQPVPQLATYAASKAFLLTLSEAVAEECRGSGVRVLALNPGPVATEFQQVAGTEVTARTLGVRTAEEVVDAALRALDRGRTSVTPGAVNYLGTVAARVFPRSVVLRAAKTVMKKLR